MARPRVDFDTAFWAKVKKTADCWIWIGGVTSKKYGSLHNVIAHRYAYEQAKGKIPDGLTIDHLCKQKLCVNPDHLEAVTRWENVRRGNTITGNNERKQFCVNGHAFTEENTYRYHGHRMCKTCLAIRDREYKARHRGRIRIRQRASKAKLKAMKR